MRAVGIIVLVLVLVALAFGGFLYATREKSQDLGPLQAATSTRKTIPIAPIAGLAAVVLLMKRRHD